MLQLVETVASSVPPGGHVLSGSELGYLALGTVFLSLGLITLLLTILRSASRDASIFLFGAMSCIWGGRFLLYTNLVPQLLTGDSGSLQHLARSLTYFGAAAAFCFAWAYLGSGWRKTLRAMAGVSVGFACLASIALLFDPDRDRYLPIFNVMVLGGAALVIANILHPTLRRRARLRGLVVGLCIAVVLFCLENLRALEIVPLPWDVEWLGVIVLYGSFGRLIAVRLFTNERRLAAIEQELATARRIQFSLLPKEAPQVAGLSIAARYLPMHDVAGDIYDLVRLADDRLGVLIADVSGHGVPAALIASMVKGAFRSQIDRFEHPEQVLDGMNRILTGELGLEFVTASYVFIDAGSGFLRYGSAGHPPMLIQQSGADSCLSLQCNGLILGQFADADYSSVQRTYAARDRLVLYTDGLFEATNARGEEFGEASLSSFLSRNRQLSTEDVADALLAVVDAWTGVKAGASLDDDVTLLVIDLEDPAMGSRRGNGRSPGTHEPPARDDP